MPCVLLDLVRYLKYGYRTYYKSYEKIKMLASMRKQALDHKDYYYFTSISRHYRLHEIR